jgi:hypothetical protein
MFLIFWPFHVPANVTLVSEFKGVRKQLERYIPLYVFSWCNSALSGRILKKSDTEANLILSHIGVSVLPTYEYEYSAIVTHALPA